MAEKELAAESIFVEAVENHQKGKFEDAEQLYTKILQINPNHFQSLGNLGAIAKHFEKTGKAKQFYEKALQINPQFLDGHYNLGVIHQEIGQNQEALSCYFKALQIGPDDVKTHFNLGNLFRELGENEEAIRFFKLALRLTPQDPKIWLNLGSLYQGLKYNDKALSCYRELLKILPDNAQTHFNTAVLYEGEGEKKKALAHYRNVLKSDPHNENVHNRIGIILRELGEDTTAIVSFQKALQNNPQYSHAQYNLGNLYERLGKLKKAVLCYEKALKIDPDNLGAHINLGITFLLKSEFNKGFSVYERRIKGPWYQDQLKKINSTSQKWQGEDLTNKTIIVFGEQGLGDNILFAQYLYFLMGKYQINLVFRTYKKLHHLFANSKFEVLSEDDDLPPHDYHIFLMSIPQIVYNMTRSFPRSINYIPKNKKTVSKWKETFSKINGIKVGINWQGSKAFPDDRYRSIPLEYFADIFTLKKINFISLQRGSGIEQINKFKYKNKLYSFLSDIEMESEENAFEDSIGVLQYLDLVVTTDTALAHLSSTLGIETWVLLQKTPDWRWFLDSDSTVWYQNTRLYRQDIFGQWESVFASVKNSLMSKFDCS